MKHCKKDTLLKIWLVTLSLCLSSCVSSQEILSREDAIEKRILQINKVEAEILRYRNEQLAYDNIRKGMLPSISLTFSPLNFNHSMRLLQSPTNGDYYNVNDYTNTSVGSIAVNQKIKATGGVFSLRSSLSMLRDFSNHSTGVSTVPLFVSYSQPLLGGGKTARLEEEIQLAKVRLAAKQLCMTITEAQREVSGLYMQVLSLWTDVIISKKAADIGDTLVVIAEKRRLQGRITGNDYNLVKIQQIENVMNLKKAQHELDNVMQRLKDILKCDSLIICIPDYSNLPESLSDDEILNKVEENNPSYLSLQIESRQSEKDIHEVKTETHFNADISVSYGLNQYDSSIAKAYRHPDQSQGVSLTLRIPVFQWGINRNKRIMVENEHEAIKKGLEQDIVDLYTSTHQLVFQYNYSREIVNMSKERSEIAQELYTHAAAKFSLGKISAVELIKANQDMFSAVYDYTNCIQSLYECYFTIRSATLYDFIKHSTLEESLIRKL